MQKVVAIIPTFNRKMHLSQVLHDFAIQRSVSHRLEIVVVVDGSADGTLEMLAQDYPEVHVVNGPGDWWYTRSMNEGFQLAYELGADFVLTMNDDVRLPDNYVSELIEASNREVDATIMGSISVTVEAPHRITFSGIKEIKWWRYKYIPHIPHYNQVNLTALSGVRDTKVLPGRGMLIPIAVLRNLEGFDSKLIQYGSDDDFCLRAAKRGVKVKVCYDAVVHSYDKLTGVGNPSRKDSFWSVIKGFRNKYSTLYLPKSISAIQRHGNKLLLPITVCIVILGSIWANLKYKKI